MKFANVTGLSPSEVQRSRMNHGSNALPQVEVESFWDKLIENFKDPLIKILLAALIVTMILAIMGYAKWYEGVGIALAVFLATFVSTFSEHKNESSFQELQEKASRVTNNVFRGGSTVESVFVTDIVVGDFVLLQAGDKVPADGRIFMGSVSVNQASLTGETESIHKSVAPPEYEFPSNPSSDDFHGPHCILRGTLVDDGEAVLRVDKVGRDTYFGNVQNDLFEGDDRASPLQHKLSVLADLISKIGYIGSVGIALSFLFKQFIMDQGWSFARTVAYLGVWHKAVHDVVTSIILAIIIIVVAVPEGLPMMIAIVLSLNMRKLLAEHVLVRKLLGIETAGSLNILFCDKTGTLTTGIFESRLFITGQATYVGVVGDEPREGGAGTPGVYYSYEAIPQEMKDLYMTCIVASTTSVRSAEGSLKGGNSSERALLRFIPEARTKNLEYSVEREILFNSERKYSASQLNIPRLFAQPLDPLFGAGGARYDPGTPAEGARVSVVKGAPELVIGRCTSYFSPDGRLAPLDREGFMSTLDYFSRLGLRFIAVACYAGALPVEGSDTQMPGGMCLVGILGLADTVRPESYRSVEAAKRAGIQVVMITGDRKETAVRVATSVGLLSGRDDPSMVLTSEAIQAMSDPAIAAAIPALAVVCRARPTDKSRLVRIAQGLNLVVGMTGDGVNDSAALRKADVGFSMGSGSEVAKEASDIVVMDDNFLSITKAVLYGRTIYLSIQKFIMFQSTVNLASGIVVFIGPFMGFDFPLTLIQLLWVNLVMDTLAALAFGGEPALDEYMDLEPIPRDQDIITPYMWSAIFCNGLFIATMCITFLKWDLVEGSIFARGHRSELGSDGLELPNEVFLTAFFAFFIFSNTINAFNLRTPHTNLLNGLMSNKGFLLVIVVIFCVQISFSVFGGEVLRTVGLSVGEWLFVIAISCVVIPYDMCRKILFYRLYQRARRSGGSGGGGNGGGGGGGSEVEMDHLLQSTPTSNIAIDMTMPTVIAASPSPSEVLDGTAVVQSQRRGSESTLQQAGGSTTKGPYDDSTVSPYYTGQ